MQVLSLVFLFVANLLDTLLNHLLCLQQHREVILDVHEDDESVADLNVVLGAEACDNCAGDFEVPLVTNVTEVFEPNMIVGIGALRMKRNFVRMLKNLEKKNSHLITDAELCDESRELCTFLVECRLVRVPSHYCLKHRVEEASVSRRFILRAGCYTASDITKDLFTKEKLITNY
jgi:hypothetical protein